MLPFDNLSDDREMQFFSDGVSEEIIQRLSRGAQMKVIGRTSSFQFRGADKTARNVAKELKCSHILDGSIRRAGGRVRIAAHLVEAASQTTLWSDRYDRSLEDIFAVQDEISEHIAAALDQTFTSFSTKAIDPAVYDLYLRASPKSYAPDELRTNVGLLEVATQRAPHFAEAWGRLAYLRAWLRFYQPFADRAASADLVANEAGRALALDPQNVDALMAQFFVLAPFGRFVEADAVVERIRAGARLGRWRIYVGWHSRAIGRLRESAEATERAYRLDALNPMSANLVALSRMATGRVAEAVPVFEDLMARVPDMSFPVANLLRAQAFLEGLGGGRPIAGSCGATPVARVSGRSGVHPDQARPHAGEHRRHPRRARGALREDGMRRRLAARVRSAPRSGRGSLPDGRDRLPRSAWHRRRHHGSGRLPHRAVVPRWNARIAQRSALRAPVRAPRPRRILVGDGQMARLRG